MFSLVPISFLTLGVLPSLSQAKGTTDWKQKCEAFTSLPAIPESINASLTKVDYYPAGALFNETDPNTSLESTSFKAFCRVQINITTSNTTSAVSEIWLPDSWSGIFWGTGNGASGGGLNWGDLGYVAVNHGFAGHATNGGHSSNGSSAVAFENPETLTDWDYRAMHQGTVAGKAITAKYYGKNTFHSYYGACSAGGRQGWIEAERFPEDYDSIITGSPAVDDIRQSASALWVNQKVLPVNGSTGSATNVGPSTQRSASAVRWIDGLKDGILSNPQRCNFRPQAIACRPGQTTGCLTAAQLGPWVDVNDTYVYAGFPYGAEAGFITGNLLADGGEYGQDGDFFRHAIVHNSSWTVDQIDFALVQRGVEEIGGPMETAMIHYVGWNDQYLSPFASIRWHDEVDSFMTTNTEYTTTDYYRLFVIPGMKHCGGGEGANFFGQPSVYTADPVSLEPSHNVIFSLFDWHQKGKAPDSFIGTAFRDNNISLGVNYERPICMWPKHTTYNGHGDPMKASSFSCAL
ncbi:tannase and feruloyl esterase-domain-containing protein [Mycena rosella]|uniref:Carboxylic ester hydrolase n=1 Tax=Mycena rosella TaxID=1033263 RepID=A0AAD7FKP7_MYCRO|nr:tannase and feruloyl esterase-domain-containing protein [Mycena rosella]